jgi:PhoPQ-activated pathogenicity-related protein
MKLASRCGGSNKKGVPNWTKPDDKMCRTLSEVASKNQAVTVLLRQTPNQPLYGDLTEDALISYTAVRRSLFDAKVIEN